MLMDVSRAQARFVSTVERYSTRSCLMRGPLCRSDDLFDFRIIVNYDFNLL